MHRFVARLPVKSIDAETWQREHAPPQLGAPASQPAATPIERPRPMPVEPTAVRKNPTEIGWSKFNKTGPF